MSAFNIEELQDQLNQQLRFLRNFQTEEEPFPFQLSSKTYYATIKRAAMDGTCLFHSMAHQIHGSMGKDNKEHGNNLRQDIVRELQNNT